MGVCLYSSCQKEVLSLQNSLLSYFRIANDIPIVNLYNASMLKFIVRIGLLYTAALVPTLGWSQLAPLPDESPVSTAPGPPPDEKQNAIFEQDVNLVDMFFTVKRSDGNLVPHLNQQNCSVRDDKVPQTFKSFVAENNVPLNLGILVDTSMSQISWLPMEQDAGSQFIRQVLRHGDQAFLISFDVNVDLLQDFTNRPEILIHALNQAEINKGGGALTIKDTPGIPPLIRSKPDVDPGPVPNANPRGTLFYDAIYQAANEKMNQVTGRKAIIVLTDGDDQGSSFTSQDAIAAMEKNNIPVFVIWLGSPDCFFLKDHKKHPEPRLPLPGQPDPPTQKLLADGSDECDAAHWNMTTCPGFHAAECMAEHTGGGFIVPQNSNQLERAFEHIQDVLRSQYWASYTPSDIKADGHFHELEIQCHADNGQNLKVQMRRGYYAPSKEK
jgi:VWFA-related protein